jgi:hypothetical protein
MRCEVRGQADISLVVGAPGDKTLVVPVAASHVSLTNNDPIQSVLYSIVAAPAFPGDWMSLGPGVHLVVDMAGGAALNLRKLRWIRYVSESLRVATPGATFPGDDVTAFVDVSEITY